MKLQKILLIDNSDIDNYVNATMLRALDIAADVVTCVSATEGLAYLRKTADSLQATPEIILLDLGMQIMDGYGFLEEFSSLPPAVTAGSKVVVLTSSIDPRDRDRSLAYPCVLDVMEKPLKVALLQQVIGQRIG